MELSHYFVFSSHNFPVYNLSFLVPWINDAANKNVEKQYKQEPTIYYIRKNMETLLEKKYSKLTPE